MRVNCANRIVVNVFAIALVSLANPILIFDYDLYQNRLIYKSNPTKIAFTMMAAHALYDLMCMVFINELYKFQFVVHHVICLGGVFGASYFHFSVLYD